MSGAVLQLPYMPVWHGKCEKLTLYATCQPSQKPMNCTRDILKILYLSYTQVVLAVCWGYVPENCNVQQNNTEWSIYCHKNFLKCQRVWPLKNQ